MLLSAELPIAALLVWCRALRHGLEAGLQPERILRQQAKSGPSKGRVLAADLAGRVAAGEALADAVAAHPTRFPALFRELLAVGEQSGRLTETLGVLEEHFEAVQKARRRLTKALMWPMFMYVSAVGIIAVMLAVMGLMPGGFDPIGLGLTGPFGAMLFLAVVAGGTAAAAFVFATIASDPRSRALAESRLLLLPGIGPVFRTLALQRFAVSLWMTQEAGLNMDKGVKLALRAAANAAYQGEGDRIAREVRAGGELHESLAAAGPVLFPDDFVHLVATGEESGSLAEVMARQSKVLQEEAARQMQWVASILGGLVYCGVALMVIGLIFRIASAISGIYSDAMKGL